MKLLRNAKLLTMDDGSCLREADLLVENGKIKAIRDRGTVSEMDRLSLAETDVMDLGGCVIIPGLIDCHVHYDDAYMGAFFLAAGVTSVRNMRGYEKHAAWRDEILDGRRIGPYIYSSGPIVDGEDETIPENDNYIIKTEEDVERAIAFTKENGFLWMKTYPSIEPDLYRYLLKRCQVENLPLCGHMTKKMDHQELADNGYICCEHTSSLPGDPEKIRTLAQSGMWLCATHVVCETMPDYVWNNKQLKDLPHFADLPAYVRADWERRNKIIIENYRRLNIHPDFQMIIDRALTFLKYSDRILAGTDCAYPGIIPGFAMADELERFVRVYKMSPYEALYSATRRPAEHMGIAEQKGSLREGMDADLVVLAEDPLQDIGNVNNIRYVFQGERFWDAAQLEALLKNAGKAKNEDE